MLSSGCTLELHFLEIILFDKVFIKSYNSFWLFYHLYLYLSESRDQKMAWNRVTCLIVPLIVIWL